MTPTLATQPPHGRDNVLMLAAISKRFGPVPVLEDVSLTVRAGTVHALLGENGAGKTTLMRIAFGLVTPDAGTVAARSNTHITSTRAAIAAGLGMVHQHFTNIPALTVAENIALGGVGRYRKARAEQRVAEIGARTGLVLDANARAGDLPVGAQQRLEIVKALARHANTLILDEPTAVLVPEEIAELLRWIRGFADAGNAVVLITHKLREALEVADDITVLRRGRVAIRAARRDVTSESLTRALFGEDQGATESVRVKPRTQTAAVVVRAQQLSIAGPRGTTAVNGATFEIRAGDIVGIAAVEGSGHRELLRAIANRLPVSEGQLVVPQDSGFVPEDRHRDALILDFTTTENIVLKNAGRRRGRIPWRSQREHVQRLLAADDVRGAAWDTPAAELSGGNQQKLILARELEENPPLLVIENPSRGLDLRATVAVHERVRRVASAATAVVVYSSDLDEVLALATRVLVVYAGSVRECPLDRNRIVRAMVGVE